MSDAPVQLQQGTSPPVDPAVARRAATRAIVAALLLGVGIAAVRGLEAAMHATFDKPPASLQTEFQSMKRELGSPVRYAAMREDEVLEPETVETLGTDMYLVREYVDRTLEAGSPGSFMNLNVNFYPTGNSTPHVPEVCWKGSGREEVGNSRTTFDVKNVKRRDGSVIDLRMRLISFKPLPGLPTANEKGEAIFSNVAYVFHVNGTYVASPQEVTSQFWKANNKYAYHAKIEITPMYTRMASNGTMMRDVLNCTQAEAQRLVSDFVREAIPAVEECLPDPSILTQNEPLK